MTQRPPTAGNLFVSAPIRAGFLLVVSAGAVGWLMLSGALPARAAETNNAAISTADARSSLPVLPVVPRPPATQPEAGLRSDTHLDKTPPRKTVGLDLVKNGWTYNCMECHKLFPARWHYDRALNEHKDIKLEHGNNRFCLNCHHPTNHNAFVDYDGAEIAQADVVLLCAKCHGTTYRDWKAGVHGRANGYWNSAMGDRTRLRCIQCHDPHFPKFQAMKPLPPLRYPSRAVKGDDEAAAGASGGHAVMTQPHGQGQPDTEPKGPTTSHAP